MYYHARFARPKFPQSRTNRRALARLFQLHPDLYLYLSLLLSAFVWLLVPLNSRLI